MQGLLARRQTDFDFEAETKFEFSPENFQQFAGMIYRYDEQTQYICAATFHETKGKVLQVLTIMPEGFSRGMEIQLDEKNPVWIKLIVHGENGFFYWSQDGKNFRQIRPLLDASKLSDEYGGQGFTGAFVGMFCADMVSYENFADYEYFSYKKI
jgi:xylan 1,4-beta-xylosidase